MQSWMRQGKRTLLLLMVLAGVSPLWARQMSVPQLQKLLEDAKAQHRDDDFVVKKLGGVKLTNRLSNASLQELLAESPGPRTTQVLRYLSYGSAFLDLPASEIPQLPPPDMEAQKAMIRQSVHYVAHTLHALPNFTATRVTQQLVDSPQGLEKAQLELLGSVYLVNTFRAPITLRDGQETEETAMADGWKVASTSFNSSRSTIISLASGPPIGLTAHGEFGPILASVILDNSKGKMTWVRWERINGKPASVYQFSVEKAASHFSVDFSQAAHVEVVDTNGPADSAPHFAGRTYNTGQAKTMEALKATEDRIVNKQLAYHGELVIDPDTGAILRIMILAAKVREEPSKQAGMVAEYGPVQVGENSYICPIHSVALSTTEEHNGLITTASQTMTETHLNVADFVGYHRFGSESTLVMNAPPSDSQHARPAEPPQAAKTETSSPASTGTTSDSPESVASQGSSLASSPASSPGHSLDPFPSAPPAEPKAATVATEAAPQPPTPAAASVSGSVPVTESAADEEILIRTADGLPGASAPADAANPSTAPSTTEAASFTLKAAKRLVSLDLVATNKRGKPIADLRQEEVEVYDNGHKQTLVDFRRSDAVNPVPAQSPASAQSSKTFTNATATAAEAPDLQILLLDETQLSNADLSHARTDLLRFLKSAPATARFAIFAVGPRGLRPIQDATQDHAQSIASLTSWTPNSSAGQSPAQRGGQSGQSFDPVQNAAGSVADPGGNAGTGPESQAAVSNMDPELRQLGAHPLRAPLTSVLEVARRFAPAPGRKSIVWISGGRAMSGRGVSGPKGAAADKGGDTLLPAVAHAHDVLNQARIALYPVDGTTSQGSTENVARDNHVDSASADTSGSGANNAHLAQHSGGGEAQSAASDEQRTLLEPVRELAESTGGHAFGAGSELKIILEGISRDSAYEVSFRPDTPDDGKYHLIQIKIADRGDAKLRYRNSYLSNQSSATNQQRFQQAVWNPQDASGIALTAEAIPSGDPASGAGVVQLHIALSSVALEQNAGRWTGQLFVYVAQRDDVALKTDVFGNTMRISLKQATYDSDQAAGIPYSCKIEPKSALGSIRIIVIDGKSGEMGSITLPSAALAPKG